MSRLDRRRRGGCGLLPLVLVGCLGVGAALGLLISWWLWPVEYTDVSPDTLRPAHRLEYVTLIAQAYAYDRDLRRAQIRLAALGDLAAMGLEVANLAEQQAVQGGETSSSAAPSDVNRIRALAALAYALGHRRSTLAAFLPGGPGYVPGAAPTATWTPWPTATATMQPATLTPSPTLSPSPTQTLQPTATPVPVSTLAPTGTPVVRASATPSRLPSSTFTSTPTPTRPTPTRRPTLTPTVTPTPEPRYELVQLRRICPGAPDSEGAPGELRITVLNAAGEPQPNVELLIRWGEGEDRAVTGLKPERGAGYADFALALGQSYQVSVIGIESEVAQGIVADECAGNGTGSGQIASWEVVFRLSAAGSSE